MLEKENVKCNFMQLSPFVMLHVAFFFFISPVAMLCVHTNTTIEAGISGIYTAGLVGLFSARAGAHSGRLHGHRYETHGPTVHYCGCVSNIQNIPASTGPCAL